MTLRGRRRFLATALALLAGCGRAKPAAARFPRLALPPLEGAAGEDPFRGPVLVNYWATWCGPCRREMASLERLRARLAGRVRVLGVTVDEDLNLAREWLRREGVRFAVLADPGARLSRVPLALEALPETFLLDAGRRILERTKGARDWDSDDSVVRILRRLDADASVAPA